MTEGSDIGLVEVLAIFYDVGVLVTEEELVAQFGCLEKRKVFLEDFALHIPFEQMDDEAAQFQANHSRHDAQSSCNVWRMTKDMVSLSYSSPIGEWVIPSGATNSLSISLEAFSFDDEELVPDELMETWVEYAKHRRELVKSLQKDFIPNTVSFVVGMRTMWTASYDWEYGEEIDEEVEYCGIVDMSQIKFI